MAKAKTWTLTDVKRNRYVEELFLGHDELGIPDCTIAKRRLSGGLADGIDLVSINNGELSFSVLPTRGMGIWKGSFRGVPLGWKSPINGPVHPNLVNLQERGGLGWLYGFDELMCRCGLDSMGAPGKDVVLDNNGNKSEVDLTLHGKIANLPASKVEIEADPETKAVTVTGEVEESAMFCPGLKLKTRISTTPLSNRLKIEDEIINLKGVPSEMEILYHCNFGEPFLGEGSRLLAPVKEMAPRDGHAAKGVQTYDVYQGPTPGYTEQVFFYTLHADPLSGKTISALKNKAGDRAIAVRYSPEQLPHFTQWKNTIPINDGYVTGLEPGTAYPNPKQTERERGRVKMIPAGGSLKYELDIEVYTGEAEVKKLEGEIRAISGGRLSKIHSQPNPKF